ncbi:membrane spanning protein in TonB-ExbB-ExbD complex [Georgfuchsia toluolica]|uniref:Biopolymer transport protein ExbD n=1 Tax=Georgfuchsia toluolica TaxID=424218 RepID=A0A916NAB2_9PROT|nr:TonB system transport protein ExbD [Georgfuchsia toluolica]CAG4885162.1 membrane spanning protein in TonB-ExbB-ExbD complex [Georgfuchsia toluolica]
MAIQLGSGAQVKRHSYQQNAEMNVTPFVDVMLVLLIIFMVAAPLATVDVPVDLPPNAAAPKPPPTEPVYISVQKDGTVFIQNDHTTIAGLPALIKSYTKGDTETRLFLRGDMHAEYGRLMAVMNVLQRGGYTKIGLVAEEESAQ